MTRHNKGFFTLCATFFALSVFFTGCEDPGSVGSEFVDSPQLTFDTLYVEQTELLNFNGYSGGLNFVPIGQYSDAIFGDINTIGLFKPTRTPSIPDSITINENFDLKLRLQIDSLGVYGDTLSSTDFTVREINTLWRENALTIDDEIELGNEVGQFSISQGQDEVLVDLSNEWIEKYKEWFYTDIENPDVEYILNFFGLAVVADQPNSKISFAQAGASSFELYNNPGTDSANTLNVNFRDHGYILERSGAVSNPNTFPIHTTLEGMLSVTLPIAELEEKASNSNIIRTDLVFYEATEELENSLPANHNRLQLDGINLDIYESFEPEYEYQFGQVEFRGARDSDENLFRVNITPFVNNNLYGNETRTRLVVGAGATTGILRSTLFYNVAASDNVRPKIIITSLAD